LHLVLLFLVIFTQNFRVSAGERWGLLELFWLHTCDLRLMHKLGWAGSGLLVILVEMGWIGRSGVVVGRQRATAMQAILAS